jgi:lipoprotein-anchoring transpeptidase ErfK/SrfK
LADAQPSAPPPAPVPTGTEKKDSLEINLAAKNPRFDNEAIKEVFKGGSLASGAKGDHVVAVQQALLDLGFALPSGSDGGFGNQTKLAISGFQSSQGLPVTGIIDAKTMRALDEVSPAPGLKAWEDPNISSKAYAEPQKINEKFARVIVDKSEHRLFLYDQTGKLEHIYPVATGKDGTETDSGLKVVNGKLDDPSEVGRRLWKSPKAFGTKLMDLSFYDPRTGKTTASGEELHGTYDDNSIGTNASHGCVRMYNKDVEQIYTNMKKGDFVVIKD